MRPKKKKKLRDYKKEAWQWFSKYIRLRDAYDGFNKCCTCGKYAEWKYLQAGHFVPGRGNAILFDERNCHLQCEHCNTYLSGSLIEYRKNLIKKIGIEEYENLESIAYETRKFTKQELKDLMQKYKLKCKELENK